MANYVGDRCSEIPGLIVPASQAIYYRDIILGEGGVFEFCALSFDLANYVNASTRYFQYDDELTGPFGANVPAIRNIDNREYIQNIYRMDSPVPSFGSTISSQNIF